MINFDLYAKERYNLKEDEGDKPLATPMFYGGEMASPIIGAKIRANKKFTSQGGNFIRTNTLDIKNRINKVSNYAHPMVKHLIGLLGTENVDVNPKVYMRVIPPAATGYMRKEYYSSSDALIQKRLNNPTSLEDLTQATIDSHYSNNHPVGVELYLVVPNFSKLEALLKYLDDSVGKSFLSLSSKKEKDKLVEKLILVKRVYASSLDGSREDYKVVAKMVFVITNQESGASKLQKINMTRRTTADDGLGFGGGGKSYTPSVEVLHRFSKGELPMLSMYSKHLEDFYTAVAKEHFEFVITTKNNPVSNLARAVNNPEAVEHRRRLKGTKKLGGKAYSTDTLALSKEGRDFAKDAELEKQEREKQLKKELKLHSAQSRANINKKEIKVAGSIRSTVTRTVIPTIRDEERVWMKSDGSLKKPDRISNQEDRGLIPSVGRDAFIRPLVETDSYSITYGIYYDNPVLNLAKKGNIFWYGEKSLMFSAAKQYATWLGDTPKLAYLIKTKISTGQTQENMYITPRELEAGIGDEVREIKNAHKDIMSRFKNNVSEGKRWFPSHLDSYLGSEAQGSKPSSQFVGYGVPISWTRIEGVPRAKWVNFLKEMHKELPKVLGFNLGAESNLQIIGDEGVERSFIRRTKVTKDPITGKLRFQSIEDPIKASELARMAVHRSKKKVWDVKDTPKGSFQKKDVWKNYVITYLLGHRAFSHQLSTFMIPIITAELPDTSEDGKTGVIPSGSNLSVSKNDYLDAMKKVGNQYPIFRNPNGGGTADDLKRGDLNTGRKWTYLKASLHQAFPYARMVIADVRNPQQVGKANESRNKNHPLTRTKWGYFYGDYEFRSFVMFVSMPQSIAEKKFKITSMGQGKNALSDPNYLKHYKSHLRKKRGSPLELGLTSSQSSFVSTEGSVFGYASKKGFKPLSVIKRDRTVLPSGYFSHPAFDRQHKVLFTQTQRQVRGVLATYFFEVEKFNREANTQDLTKEAYDKRMSKIDNKHSIIFDSYSASIQNSLIRYLGDLKKEVAKDRAQHFGSLDGDDTAQEAYAGLDNYVTKIKQEFKTAEGGTLEFDLPSIGIGHSTPEWTAMLGRTAFGGSFDMKVKATTSDMAKMIFIYRLLRRSHRNPALGKRAHDTFRGTNRKIIDTTSAKLLHLWAKSGYIVVQNNDPKGLRRIPGKTENKFARNEFMRQHSATHGEHSTARLVGFGAPEPGSE